MSAGVFAPNNGALKAAPQSSGCWDWSQSYAPNALGIDGPAFALASFDDDASGPDESQLIAGGAFQQAGGVACANIAAFDGQQWTPLDLGMQGSQPLGVRALAVYREAGASVPALFAGGQFATAGSVQALHIARWNGTTWSSVGSGVTGQNVAVTSLTTYDPDGNGPQPEELVIGGQFRDPPFPRFVAKWDGTNWSPLGPGLGGDVHALHVYDSGAGPKLFACGGVNASHIACWDGQAWSAVGGGLDGDAHAMTVWDPDGTGPIAPQLIVGGSFSMAGNLSVSNVAAWDGTAWSSLGNGLNGEVWSLEVTRAGTLGAGATSLIAGGDFGGHIASWDGASWSTVGNGVNARVSALCSVDPGLLTPLPSLFVGGGFSTAGATASDHIAEWTGCGTWTYCTAGTTTHGCMATIGSVGTPSASASTGFVLTASNVEGQKSGLFFYGSAPGAIPWQVHSTSWICVVAPYTRTTILDSGGTDGACDGSLALDWNAWRAAHPSALGSPFTLGNVFYVQAWFRDPPAPKGTNLSDALGFVLGP